MKQEYFENLKKIDTHDVAMTLKKDVWETCSELKLHAKCVSYAYVLYRIAEQNNANAEDFEHFIESINLAEDVIEALRRNIEGMWDPIKKLKNKYDKEQLAAFILFDNSSASSKTGTTSTPEGISKLACSILNIKKGEHVLDLCSGKGGFLIEAFEANQGAFFKGVELNYACNDIAIIRGDILGAKIECKLHDVFDYGGTEKFDKVFSNYPFGVKIPANSKYRHRMQELFSMSKDDVRRTSADWVFNATMIKQMDSTGKAVAIMTNGSAWNSIDKNVRKYFIEHGYVEMAIALPTRLFENTLISVTMVVFSRNNETVKLVDARKFFSKKDRFHYLSNTDVNNIIDVIRGKSSDCIIKNIDDFAEDEYVLNPIRYLEPSPEIENGVEFGTVIKNITRGAQLKARELEKLKSEEATNYQYLMLSNINDGIICFEEKQFLKGLDEKLLKYCIKNNTIVLSKVGIPMFKSAVAQIDDNKELLATGNMFVIELDETKANPFYIQALLDSELGRALLKSIYTGATLHTISMEKLKKLRIPLPSIQEQERIGNRYAACIDEVVLLKKRLEKTIAKMKHIYDEEV